MHEPSCGDYYRYMQKLHAGSIQLGIRDELVDVSDHIGYFWETEQEFAEAVAFLEYGLHGNDSCVVFGHAKANAKVLGILDSHGFDTKNLAEQGRLIVLSGKPSGGDMLSEIGGVFQKAIDAGAELVRLLGNIGWGHEGWPTELDILEFEARVTAAWSTSLEVEVQVFSEETLTGVRRMTSIAYLTFVAVDRDGRRQPVPGLILETAEEKQKAAEADVRRAERLKARAALEARSC